MENLQSLNGFIGICISNSGAQRRIQGAMPDLNDLGWQKKARDFAESEQLRKTDSPKT